MPFVPSQGCHPTYITKIVPMSFLLAEIHFHIESQLPDSGQFCTAEIIWVTQGENALDSGKFSANFLYLKMHEVWFKRWEIVWTNFYFLEMSLLILS